MSRFCVFIALLLALAATGCRHPLSAYEQGRKMLDSGHGHLRQGDVEISARNYDAATATYGRAVNDLDNAVVYFQQAEMQVMDEIRLREQQQRASGRVSAPTSSTTVTIGQRQVEVSAFHADTLRGYREARALAVVLDALAMARSAEASYRQAAVWTHAGDHGWKSDQFNSALRNYQQSREGFLRARQGFGRTAAFIEQQMLASSQLSAAAPHESWQTLKALQPLISRRLQQIDGWLVTLDRRVGMAARIVDAYRHNRPGNLPGIKAPFLEPLPSETRVGVEHPPIPANRTSAR